MGWKVRGLNLRLGENFCTRPARLLDQSSLLYKGLCIIPGCGGKGGVKWQNRCIDHTSSSTAEVKESVRFTSIPPLGIRGLF